MMQYNDITVNASCFENICQVGSRYKVYTHNDVLNDEPDELDYVKKKNIIIELSDNDMYNVYGLIFCIF